MRRIVLAAVALVMCATLAHSGSKAGLSWKHEGYKNGGLGKYIEISNKVSYTV